MSCNGCRILRKGCNENCILRQSLQGIDTPLAQANATVFVAKFFGRAGLMSFLSSVPESQRPALFQSVMIPKACGRTVNPVNGAVGLLSTGNWHVCQTAVKTVLRGGALRPIPECLSTQSTALYKGYEANNDDLYASRELNSRLKRKGSDHIDCLDLGLTAGGRVSRRSEKRRPASPSDESEMTTMESGIVCDNRDQQQNYQGHETKLLRLFFSSYT